MSIKLKDQNNNEIFIAGTNSEDFINDEVLRNDKTWSSNKIVEELYPTFQKEGNPITCYPVENYPLNVKATFLLKQAGTGDPSPENVRPISGWDSVQVTRCGKNLFGGEENIWVGPTGNQTVEGAYSSLLIPCKEGDVFTLSTSAQFAPAPGNVGCVCFYNLENEVLDRFAVTYENSFNRSSPPGASYVRASCYRPDKDKIQFELGSTPTPYEPYQGETSTLTLPETIYGGTVDAVTGVGSKTWSYIASYNGESLPGEWISDRDVYTSGTTPTTGAQVAYKLAIPEPFQASGNQALPAVAGLNTVYTDGDSLIISGKEDIKYTINQITSNIQNINQIQEINNILLGVE